jgi:hypothetical protein
MSEVCDDSGNFDEGQGPPGVEQVFGPGGTEMTMPVSLSQTTGPMDIIDPAGHAVLLLGSDAVPPTR